jgi:neutral trehalase
VNDIQTSGALFQAVQLLKLFPDSKTFADAEPRVSAEQIESEFRALLLEFVQNRFDLNPISRRTLMPCGRCSSVLRPQLTQTRAC